MTEKWKVSETDDFEGTIIDIRLGTWEKTDDGSPREGIIVALEERDYELQYTGYKTANGFSRSSRASQLLERFIDLGFGDKDGFDPNSVMKVKFLWRKEEQKDGWKITLPVRVISSPSKPKKEPKKEEPIEEFGEKKPIIEGGLSVNEQTVLQFLDGFEGKATYADLEGLWKKSGSYNPRQNFDELLTSIVKKGKITVDGAYFKKV